MLKGGPRPDVLANNLEDRPKIPWEDLRYVFGEIMYGGHITDDLDRVLCSGYLGQAGHPQDVPQIVGRIPLEGLRGQVRAEPRQQRVGPGEGEGLGHLSSLAFPQGPAEGADRRSMEGSGPEAPCVC